MTDIAQGAAQQPPDDISLMDYFELPERRVQVTAKLPESLKAGLHATVRLWKLMARVRGMDPSDIDLTHVIARLLKIGVDGVWAQAGAIAGLNGMPKDDAEWALLEAALIKRAEEERASASKK